MSNNLTMRQLASIQTIKSLEPIPGAESIEKATVLGWSLVVKKGEFQVGDLCVYIEIDSVLPDRPEFEFLKSKGFRIKTIRLRGQISQGIALPLTILAPVALDLVEKLECANSVDGFDVTELLGVTKYDPPIPAELAGTAKGNFPSFIPKTDETRVQNLQRVLDKYKGQDCYVTEKLDGSSATFYLKDGVFGVCSRNIDLIETEGNSFWKAARVMDIENKLRSFGDNFAIQGELIGEGIQGNKYGLKGQTVRFFNLFDISECRYCSFSSFMAVMRDLELPTVPILRNNMPLENDIDWLVGYATIRSTLRPEIWAEGVVIRPLNEHIDLLLSKDAFNNGRVSFKVINPEFLLKFE